MKKLQACIVAGALASAVVALAPQAQCGVITPINTASSGGYTFENFDGPTPNAAGTTINGISNTGTVVGFTTADMVTFNNFTANPLLSNNAVSFQVGNSTAAMGNGINSNGSVVGLDGNGNAFSIIGGNVTTFIPGGGTSAVAFGINDNGVIVGQYTTTSGTMPGFVLDGKNLLTINAPSGPNTVNAQGINNNGLVVGFYVGTDTQDHGFSVKVAMGATGAITGVPIADPVIPPVPGEPGAKFVFSQILGINDQGIAVGYYGDTTTSQHGFLYNTNTGKYTFLDNPDAMFTPAGVEVTQITGINNQGEITGFYTDAAGVPHGFVAIVPEPASWMLLSSSVLTVVGLARRRARGATSAD